MQLLADYTKSHNIFSSHQPYLGGHAFYWNDEELIIEPYNDHRKRYFCGKHLLTFPDTKHLIYQILLVDSQECTFAQIYSDGEMRPIFEWLSYVPNKQKCGGQSALRFARAREGAILAWYRKINEHLKTIQGDIVLGMNPVYQRRFLDNLSTYNRQKVTRIETSEYCNWAGVSQMFNKLQANRS